MMTSFQLHTMGCCIMKSKPDSVCFSCSISAPKKKQFSLCPMESSHCLCRINLQAIAKNIQEMTYEWTSLLFISPESPGFSLIADQSWHRDDFFDKHILYSLHFPTKLQTDRRGRDIFLKFHLPTELLQK